MTERCAEVEIQDGLAMLTLTRESRANSLGVEMFQDLSACLDEIAESPGVRAVVISARGRHFCAGGDLDHPLFSEPDAARRRDHITPAYDVVRQILDLQVPVVCAVHGRCAGAALAIVLASDIRIADATASFSVDFVRLGLAPDMGVTWLLGQSVGAGRALDLALSGDVIDAERAERWGIVTRLTDAGGHVDAAVAAASQMASFPAAGLAAGRRLVRRAPYQDREDAFESEITTMTPLVASAETQARLQAFRDRTRS